MIDQRCYVRVSLLEDGKTPKRELMIDGVKAAELSYIDTLELAMQATSSLRYEKRESWPTSN
jgi:hypothetical protein